MTEPVELAVSTSAATSCALRVGGGEIDRELADRGELLALVETLLQRRGVALREVSALAVDLGPGSYTGLRTAVTFARFLGELGRASTAVATSFELIAAAAARDGALGGGDVARIALDARRGRIHTALVAVGPPIALLEPPRAVAIEEFTPEAAGGVALFAAPSLAAVAGLGRAMPLPEFGAELLLEPGIAPRPAGAVELRPLYLMGSYAED